MRRRSWLAGREVERHVSALLRLRREEEAAAAEHDAAPADESP